MDIEELNIKLIRQQPQSTDCLRCCGLMVFHYFRDKISKQDLWKKLHAYKKFSGLEGSYFSDLGLIALKKKYQATIFHHDWHWWDEESVQACQKSAKNLLNCLNNLKNNKKKWSDKKIIEKEIQFIKQGGKIKFQIPDLNNIDYYLSQKIPVIVILAGQDFYHNPEQDYLHSILITGKKDFNYLIKDPYLDFHKISQEEFNYSWQRSSAWMMVFNPTDTVDSQIPLFS